MLAQGAARLLYEALDRISMVIGYTVLLTIHTCAGLRAYMHMDMVRARGSRGPGYMDGDVSVMRDASIIRAGVALYTSLDELA